MNENDSAGADSKKILVKTYMNEDEHKQVRHAAAERGLSISDYVKEAVLADVEKVMAEFIKGLESRAKK